MSEVISYNEMMALFQETRNLMQENELRMKQQMEERRRHLEEQRQQMEEQRRQMEEQRRQIEERRCEQAETARQIKELGKRFGDLGNRLGEFVESMVRPAVVKLFQERGLDVHKVHGRSLLKDGKENLEVDLLVTNCGEMVAVECKSRLTRRDVEDHVRRMEKLKRLAPEYRDLKVCGAVAGMVVDADAAEEAVAAGLFLLVQNGENVEVATPPGFVARAF